MSRAKSREGAYDRDPLSRRFIRAVAYRNEILRGVRLAAVAFAAVLLSVAGYRLLVPAAEAPAAPPPPPVQPQPAPPERIDISAPRETPAPVIPPPPPPLRRIKRVPAPRVIAPAPAEAAPPESLPSPSALAESAAQAPADEAPKELAQDSAEPPVIVKPPDPRPSRPSRWMRAVGRALHLGARKETAPDAFR